MQRVSPFIDSGTEFIIFFRQKWQKVSTDMPGEEMELDTEFTTNEDLSTEDEAFILNEEVLFDWVVFLEYVKMLWETQSWVTGPTSKEEDQLRADLQKSSTTLMEE